MSVLLSTLIKFSAVSVCEQWTGTLNSVCIYMRQREIKIESMNTWAWKNFSCFVFLHLSTDSDVDKVNTHFRTSSCYCGGSLVAQTVENLSAWGRPGLIPGLGRSPREGNGNLLQYPAWRFHGQRRLAGYSPWGPKELDTTGWLTQLVL